MLLFGTTNEFKTHYCEFLEIIHAALAAIHSIHLLQATFATLRQLSHMRLCLRFSSFVLTIL